MKRTSVVIAGSLCAIAVISTALAKTMSVQVQSTQLRSSADKFSDVVATVKYTDELNVIEKKGNWVKVSTPDQKTGWIHSSALTTAKLAMTSGGPDAQAKASSGEMNLVNKGFNEKVESEFKNRHPDVDFKWIDKMKAMTVSDKEIQSFVKEGGLKVSEGGAQ